MWEIFRVWNALLDSFSMYVIVSDQLILHLQT